MTVPSIGICRRFDRAPEGRSETDPRLHRCDEHGHVDTQTTDIQTTHRPASTTNIFGANIFGDSRGSAILGASNYLRLAAAPTCAIMALLTGVNAGPTDLLCSAAHDASPLSGMAAMYLLMSILHAPPWLKLMSNRRKRRPRGRSCA